MRGKFRALRRYGLTDAVTPLARSLKENHRASNDFWQDAIEATLSFANEAR
jgi:hypothetical protein